MLTTITKNAFINFFSVNVANVYYTHTRVIDLLISHTASSPFGHIVRLDDTGKISAVQSTRTFSKISNFATCDLA